MILLIDYGSGNLRSISNALRRIGARVKVATPNELRVSDPPDAIVLPGVGSFGSAMQKIEPFRDALLDILNSGVPFLGLCLGLQVLFEGSEESPGVRGLGLFPGRCVRFSDGKVPHMGWNEVFDLRGPLFDGIKTGESFYFVHSYYARVGEQTTAVCTYISDFSAAVQQSNIFACQFHPERSGRWGLRVLENFLREVKK